MLETKVFEIRDRATFFVAYATRAVPASDWRDISIRQAESYLLRRDGFGPDNGPFVILCRPDGRSFYDPYSWADRTHTTAHLHITENWDDLLSGAVIDVEFILGETAAPKLSERITAPL